MHRNPSSSGSISARRRLVASVAILGGGLAAVVAWSGHAKDTPATSSMAPDKAAEIAAASEQLATLPLAFEANLGQTDERVDFVARTSSGVLYLAGSDAVLGLPGGAITLSFPGASDVQPQGRSDLGGKSNYFLGNDPSQWIRGAPHFGQIVYDDIYPGVDLVWHGAGRAAEYDFVVEPGADPSRIRVKIDGAQSRRLDADGNLRIRTADGEVVQHAPFAYQKSGESREQVAAEFVLQEDGTIAFALGAFDAERTLVIDPVTTYITYLGGSGSDIARDVELSPVDAGLLICGATDSLDFPLGPTTILTAPQGGTDAFIVRMAPDGQSILFSTYIGGSAYDEARDLTVTLGTGTPSFSVFVTGDTTSTDFPTTSLAPQTTHGGGLWDAFVCGITIAGDRFEYCTYLGGSLDDFGRGISTGVVPGPIVAVTGYTSSSTDFPLAGAPFDATYNGGEHDVFVSEFSTAGPGVLLGSTYFGGEGDDRGYAVFRSVGGVNYVTGYTMSPDLPVPPVGFPGVVQPTFGGFADAFVAQFDTTTALLRNTFFGGVGFEAGNDIDLNVSTGAIVVTGNTDSFNFPVARPEQDRRRGPDDAFVFSLNNSMTAANFSTYLGGSGSDSGLSVTVDAVSGDVIVGGETGSVNFPVTIDAFHAFNAGGRDGMITRYDSTGVKEYGTYIGGAGHDAVEGVDGPFAIGLPICGVTESVNFPQIFPFQGTPGGGLSDAFVGCIGSAGPILIPLHAEEVGVADVALSWDDTVSDETSFEVSRRDPNPEIGTTLVAIVPAGTTSLTDSDLEPGTTYGYTVHAVLPDGSRQASNFAQATTVPLPPTAPATLRAEETGGAMLHFTWVDDSDNEVGFRLERSIAGGTFVLFGVVAANATEFDVADVPTKTGVTAWRLVAWNRGGENASDTVEAAGEATFEVALSKGVMKDSARTGRDKISVRGFLNGAAGFDPVTQTVNIVMGDLSHPFTVTIPANDPGWKRKKGRVEWKSRLGSRKIKFKIDRRKGKFSLSVKGAQFDAPHAGDIAFGISLGSEAGSFESLWADNGKGKRALR